MLNSRPMRPPLRMIAAGLAVAMAAACFNFGATMAGGVLVDSGGPPGDAGIDVSIHLPPLALDGGRPKDVARGEDARVLPHDSGIWRDGAPFCANRRRPDGGIFFCDDFDEGPLPGSWMTYGDVNGTIVESDASALSPPCSAEETVLAVASGTVINVALRTTLNVPSLPSTMRLTFDVEPVRIDTTGGAAIVLGAIDFLDSVGNRYTVALDINVAEGQPGLAMGVQNGRANGGDFPDGAPPSFNNYPLAANEKLPIEAWTNIVVELDWTTSSLQAKIFVGGSAQLSVPLTMTVVPMSLQIGIGTSFVTEYDSGLSPVWEVRYDNVVFTAE